MITDEQLEARIAKTSKMTIALCAIPEMGHFTPLARLGKYLADVGHDVHFVTFSYHKDKVDSVVKNSEINCQIHYFDEDDPMPRECLFYGLSWKKTGQKSVTIDGFDEFYPIIQQRLKTFNPDIMICDVMSVTFGMAADLMNLPVIVNDPLPL